MEAAAVAGAEAGRHRVRVDCRRIAALALVTVAALGAAWIAATAIDRATGSRAATRPTGVVFGAVPVGAQAVVSRTLGRGLPTFWVVRSSGLRAWNRRSGLAFRFGRGGAVATGAGATLSLGLQAVGRGRALRAVGDATPAADRNRVVYRYGGGVAQWFANGPLGLEHGFTLRRRPAGRHAARLSLVLSFGARGWRPVLAPGGREVELLRAGRVVLRYGGLSARDVTGRRLRSWFQLTRGRLVVHVADAGARYPLTIDPLLETAELTASDGASGDALGTSVAVSGDTLVAGAPDASVSGHADQGAVYVFTEPASGWTNATETAKLTASNGVADADLGASVAVSGNTIVASGSGSAYVFEEPGPGWTSTTQTAELTASGGAAADPFASVAIDDRTIVAGAPTENSVFEFVEPPSGWATGAQTAILTASDAVAGDELGQSVGVSGSTVVAGAPDAATGALTGKGVVYVFDGGQTAELTALDGLAGDELGAAVAVSGSTIVAGAPGKAVAGVAGEGTVYVFAESGSEWATTTQTAELTASDAAEDTTLALGSSVAVDGNMIVAGMPLGGGGPHRPPGKAYVYLMPSTGWATGSQTIELNASDGIEDNLFGGSVAVSGSTAVVGAANASAGTNALPGAAYAFTLTPVVESGGVSDVSPTSAVASGSVDGRGTTVSDCEFDYGPTASYGMSLPCGGVIAASGASAVSAEFAGLTPGATYHYRIVATNQAGTTDGADTTFTTVPPPAITAGGATEVSRTGALVSGSVNAEGLALSECEIEYGRTTTYGNVVPCPAQAGGKSSPVLETVQLTGLTPGVAYHYRLVAASAAGTTDGPDSEFTTLLAAIVATDRATGVSRTGATLRGTVNSEGAAVSGCYFEYGLTKRYGSEITCTGKVAHSKKPVPVASKLTGLAAGTRYHYRLVATTGAGTSDGSDRTLTTKPLQLLGVSLKSVLPSVAGRTVVDLLVVEGTAPGVKVRILCHGGGCPFGSRVLIERTACKHGRCTRPPAALNLTGEFSGAHLSPGTVLTITITKPGTVGKSYSFTIPAAGTASPSRSCIAPGQRPQPC